MSIKNPITTPSQMLYPLVCGTPGAEWYSRSRNPWWATNSREQPANDVEKKKMEKMFVLRDKLLSFGGCEVCLPLTEEDYDAIMRRGQLFYAKGVKYRKGESSQCHRNSALLWDANRGHCQIATGYALSKDGIWRQHSWVVQPLTVKWRVWETTVSRVAYFGFIMTDEECDEFYSNNE